MRVYSVKDAWYAGQKVEHPGPKVTPTKSSPQVSKLQGREEWEAMGECKQGRHGRQVSALFKILRVWSNNIIKKSRLVIVI